jgi:hypothetical protein
MPSSGTISKTSFHRKHLFHEASLAITVGVYLGVELIHERWLVAGSGVVVT